MATSLDTILEEKKRELIRLKEIFFEHPPHRPGKKEKVVNFKGSGTRVIIAEIKRRSPSRGDIRENLDPRMIASEYISAGARGISVLTDGKFFGGSREDLESVVSVAGEIPVLRKDFIIAREQVYETAMMGADMVLFIARVLGAKLLKSLVSLSSDLGLSPLVEVHSLHELDWAVDSGAQFIGINNRDLVTFHVDTEISKKLLPHIPDDRTKIVESGLKSSEEMEELEEMGADAFLVGETIVGAPFPGKILRKLLGSN